MIAFTDSEGASLSGGSNYRLHLPPNIPARIFWSMTLISTMQRTPRALLSGQPFPSLGSRDKPAQNADGSTDLYLSPESTCGQTRQLARDRAGQGYFTILRLYGPTEASIDRSWKPGDIDKVK